MAFNASSNFINHGGAHNIVHGNQTNTTHTITHLGSQGQDSLLFRIKVGLPFIADDTPEILRSLAAQAAMNACYDAEARFPQPNCHPNTRVETLEKLGRWIEDKSVVIRVQWVHGSAGVGKSAIAQKLSEDHLERLAGAFFFSRNDKTRDNLAPFVATLAYQCCTSDPLRTIVGPFIIDAIRSNPNIFRASVETQFRKLLLEPFAKVTRVSRRRHRQGLPNLIVVDGLDECVDLPSQLRLLDIIGVAIAFTTPNPFKFLLCSRPEPQIRSGINQAGFVSYLEQIQISGTTIRFLGSLSESDRDILRYLSEKFASLREKYRSVLQEEGNQWPSEDDIASLVWRASGQFIFAATVIKYIDTLDELPQERLRTILSTEPRELEDSPYPDLDALYRQILSACRHWDKVRPILRLLVSPHPVLEDGFSGKVAWHSPVIIAGLLRLKQGEIQTFLSRLHSVIHVPEDKHSTIEILHASFTELLVDRTRSKEFYISPYSQAELGDLVPVLLLHELSPFIAWYPPYCLSSQSFGPAYKNWEEKVDTIKEDTLLWFSISYWSHYCCRVRPSNANLLAEMNEFDPYVVGALAISAGYRFSLYGWKNCLTCVKALGPEAPQKFVEALETFLCACYVGCHQDTLRLHAAWGTLKLEVGFANHSDERVGTFFTYYRRWWAKNYDSEDLANDRLEEPEEQHYRPLLFPVAFQPSMDLPQDWVVCQVTKSNRDMLQRIYDIHQSLNIYFRGLFDHDVINDTCECIVRGLVEEKDLAELKALLYERRGLFSTLPSRREPPLLKGRHPPPDPPTNLPQSPKSPNFGSILGFFKRQSWLRGSDL